MIGCSEKKGDKRFTTYRNEKGQIEAYTDSYIDKNFLGNYYVIEVLNNITNTKELYIAEKREIKDNETEHANYVYKNVFNNYMITYSSGYCNDYYLEIVDETPLSYYIEKFSMLKSKYSDKDMRQLLDMIKKDYTLEKPKGKKKELI